MSNGLANRAEVVGVTAARESVSLSVRHCHLKFTFDESTAITEIARVANDGSGISLIQLARVREVSVNEVRETVLQIRNILHRALPSAVVNSLPLRNAIILLDARLNGTPA